MTRLIKILTAVLIVMFPVGLFLMLSGEMWKQYLWTTNIFLALQAAVTFIYLIEAAEKKQAAIIALTILALAFVIEFFGVNTGFPFGRYSYTNTLKPALFGIPLAITLSWFTIAVNSYLVTRFFLFGSGRLIVLAVSSIIILAIDLLLEPFASLINGYWIWDAGEIPVQNYISWLAAGFVFSYMLDRFVIWNRNVFLNMNFVTIPVVILSINVLQFAVVNVYFGYVIVTLTGLAMLAASALFSLKIGKNES